MGEAFWIVNPTAPCHGDNPSGPPQADLAAPSNNLNSPADFDPNVVDPCID
jgi:hypothetical protein